MKIKYFFSFLLCTIFLNDHSQITNETVEVVFKDLVDAFGRPFTKPPSWKIDDNKLNILSYSPNKKNIKIDPEVLSICQTFGKDSLNALAFLLGHELAHHYQGHGIDLLKDFNTREFSFKNNLIYKSDSSGYYRKKADALKRETNADLIGGFKSHIAGYNSLPIAPKLMDILYRYYNKDTIETSYPSLVERKNMCIKQIEKLEKYKAIFDGASYAMFSGYYKGAINAYLYILEANNGFKSREIYNNLGLAYMLEAFSIINKEKNINLGYPFEYDAKTRLSLGETRGGSNISNNEIITKLLEKSRNEFNLAIMLDKDYKPAYLNLSCNYSLLAEIEEDENDKKEEHLKTALKKLEKYGETESNESLILSGILDVQLNNENKAKKKFIQASKNGSELAEINLSILDSGKIEKAPIIEPKKETIKSDINLYLDIEINQPDFKRRLADSHTLFYKEFESYMAYFFIDKETKNNVKFLIQIIKGDDHVTRKGVKINDNVKTVLEKYGNPAIIRGNKAEHYWYENSNIVFFVKDKKVTKWLVYASYD